MGAPKQKWTAEEEEALKAGVCKHGRGKWATILSDPEFSEALHFRSNVDLKDKWRNVNASAMWGSRKKEKLARAQLPTEQDDNALAHGSLPQSDDEMVDVLPLAVSGEPMQTDDSKKPIASMENHILEAIKSLKKSDGFTRASIAEYIEDQYLAPPNLTNILGEKLKDMVENGTLTKIKHKYWIAHGSPISKGRQKMSPKKVKNEIKMLTKAKVDEDLSKMRRMSAEEMAAAAAQAVAEAEAAMAAAEAATREADAAEAEAEAAQMFARAAEEAWRSGMGVNPHKGVFITHERRSMCPLFLPD